MDEPTVSVVMPAYNAAATIGAALESLTTQDISDAWEIIVADNNSTDDTAAIAASFHDRLPLSVVPAPVQGVNSARNAGVLASRASRIVLADSDDLFGPGYVRAMRDAIGEHTVVGGWLDRRHLPPDVEVEYRFDAEPVSSIFDGEWLRYPVGCASGFDRALYDEIGGFDPTIAGGGDEIDAYWRAQLVGAELAQAGPDAVVIRRERPDAAALGAQAANFGRIETVLAYRYAAHGHPGHVRRKAWRRALRWSVESLIRRGPEQLEAKRRRAYHGAAARQAIRFALRLDPAPPPADVRLGPESSVS